MRLPAVTIQATVYTCVRVCVCVCVCVCVLFEVLYNVLGSWFLQSLHKLIKRIRGSSGLRTYTKHNNIQIKRKERRGRKERKEREEEGERRERVRVLLLGSSSEGD